MTFAEADAGNKSQMHVLGLGSHTCGDGKTIKPARITY